MTETSPPVRPDYRTRRLDILATVRAQCAEGMLITNLNNVFFLTGFTGSNGALALLQDGQVTLVTDPRYRDQALEECTDTKLIIDRDVTRRALRVAEGPGNRHGQSRSEADRSTNTSDSARVGAPAFVGGERIAFEADHLPVSMWRSLLADFGGDRLVPTSGLVELRRRQKDAGEIALIESACNMAESALLRITSDVHPGMTEREIARALDFAMLELGADDRAFETIVAAGPNSAIPHHSPTERILCVGDLLKIDFGARLGRYHSDITRTFIVGGDPSAEQIRWHSAVADAAAAARESLVAGVPASLPYRSAHASLAEAGLADAFTHGLGHGVGLAIHEAPIMTAGSGGTLVADDVLTVEPGVYFPGIGGVRIEDTLVVTDTGSRSLTSVPRGLVRLG